MKIVLLLPWRKPSFLYSHIEHLVLAPNFDEQQELFQRHRRRAEETGDENQVKKLKG